MGGIVGYARVSTPDQDLAGQRLRLERAGAFRVFEDVATGRHMRRPGLEAALDQLRPGDTLAIVRLDRLGRSLRELCELAARLEAAGVALHSLEEKLDTTSAAGKLAFHFFGAMAEFERGLIAERTRDGIEAARRRGKHPGRPSQDERAASARLLVAAGTPRAQAAKQLGIGRTTLFRYLRGNPLPEPGEASTGRQPRPGPVLG